MYKNSNLLVEKNEKFNTSLLLLSGKVKQLSIEKSHIVCGIDRIEGHFHKKQSMNLSSIEKHHTKTKYYKNYGWVKIYKLNGLTINLRWSKKDDKIYGYYFSLNNPTLDIYDLITSLLKKLPEIKTSHVTRVDLNADIYNHFSIIRKLISVRYKQNFTAYDKKSDKMQGLRYGKGDEEIVVYSKNLTFKHPITRIELRLRNKKLPKDRSLISILTWIATKEHFKAIQFKNLETKKLKRSNKRLTEFIYDLYPLITMDLLGFHEARKDSKNPQNFARDIKNLINVSDANIDLDTQFLNQVSSPLLKHLNIE